MMDRIISSLLRPPHARLVVYRGVGRRFHHFAQWPELMGRRGKWRMPLGNLCRRIRRGRVDLTFGWAEYAKWPDRRLLPVFPPKTNLSDWCLSRRREKSIGVAGELLNQISFSFRWGESSLLDRRPSTRIVNDEKCRVTHPAQPSSSFVIRNATKFTRVDPPSNRKI